MTQDAQPCLLDAPADPPATGLVVHRCSRADRLADALAEVLDTPLADPFSTELVCVPAPGVERWLSQTLSTRLGTSSGRGDGVCAGIDFIRLDRLLGQILGQVLGLPLSDDPWHGDRPVWTLLRTLDDSRDQPWFDAVRVGLGPQARNRFQSARRVTRLFRRYAAQRPTLLEAWRSGADTGPDGAPLDDYSRWQPALWRGLVEQIGRADPALRVTRAAELLAADPRLVDLPPRLSVFGPTRLSPEQLTLLEALARHRRLHLFLPHPSPQLWSTLSERRLTVGPRADDPTAELPGNRLLARLGRDARELQISLSALDLCDRAIPEPQRSDTLLGRLQQAVVGNLDPDSETGRPLRRTLADDDHSVHFHSCHGPDRQVEVLREVVLGLLADDPTLEPRDIIVMCPDIETFAPLIEAAFSLDGIDELTGHPGQRLRIRLADRALRQLNPLLGTLARLLELPVTRCGASELLDLCADPAVMRRFSFTDSELERLHELVPAAGVRWGLDAAHRESFAMQGFPQNTWRSGLQRMLLGVAMSTDGQPYRGTVTPMDDIDSSDVDLIGRLVELITRLGRVLDSFARAQPLSDWLASCRDALTALTEVASSDRWQLAHAWGELADLGESAGGTAAAGEEPLLQPSDLRALLADAFAGRPSRANFRTGALTLCTMTPMRSVPHRVVCLLGLDDGVFPRRLSADGDDLLAEQPWIGDRDPRSEDRQVLLDAVLAATEKLVVVHSGASIQTGEPRPASVPVTELREALHELLADPGEVARMVTRHSLQPFDSSNFRDPTPFSFDIAMRAAALASATGGCDGAGDLAAPPTPSRVLAELPELAGEHNEVALADLLAFFAHPAKAFLRRRAGLYPSDEEETQLDEMPLELDGLQKWQIGERLLRATLAGTPLADQRTPELLRGDLPPFRLGDQVLQQVADQVSAIVAAAEPQLGARAESRWVDVDLGRWRVTGLVPGIHGNKAIEVGFSRIKGKQRLRAWITLLMLRCSHPETDWRSVVIGKGSRGRGSTVTLGPVSLSDARARLNELVGLYAQGLREWLPIPPNTCAEEVSLARRNGDPTWLRRPWEFEHDPAWQMFLSNRVDALRAIPGVAADHTSGRSRFAALAHRIWEPLMDAEVRR